MLIAAFFCGCYLKEKRYAQPIKQYAEQYDVDAELILAVCRVESNFDEEAVSAVGAVGLMQIMPLTARWLCEEKLDLKYEEEMLKNCDYNLKLGSYYLSYLISVFKDESWAVAAYNAGEGIVRNWIADGVDLDGIPYKETRDYVRLVMRYYKIYQNREIIN